MKFSIYSLAITMLVAVWCSSCSISSNKPEKIVKELYIPDTVYMVPAGNDYGNDTSSYNYKHMKVSENAALFWHKAYGENPMLNTDTTRRFDPNHLLKEFERIYNYYVNELKLVEKGNSLTDKYKVLIYIFDADGGTAFGGGGDNKVGIFWASASRMNKPPYGALAHELGHSFQYLIKADGATTFTKGFSIYEMTSQYLLWQVYPKWMTFENYHLIDFMKQTHYCFLHEINMYHSPYVLEYWSNKHGIEFMGKLWREANEGEDAVMAYKRITGIDQETFNAEIYDAACRFMTWDIERIDSIAAPYANQHTCKMIPVNNDWFQIDSTRCPQNYGYNGIQLIVPSPGTSIKVEFEGIAGTEGFNTVNRNKAGWRYGFVAVQKNGERRYSQMFSDEKGQATFSVPDNTEYLWLVVTGAPSEHWIHEIDANKKNDEEWPYQIKLTGTLLEESVLAPIAGLN